MTLDSLGYAAPLGVSPLSVAEICHCRHDIRLSWLCYTPGCVTFKCSRNMLLQAWH